MGSNSKSSSASSSAEYSNSLNTTVTSAVSGAQAVGLQNSGTLSNSPLTYSYDSGNTTTTNNTTNAIGANSSASGSASGDTPAATDADAFDWSDIVTYVIAGVVLVYVLHLLGDNKQ
jgi:hypothetical protein